MQAIKVNLKNPIFFNVVKFVVCFIVVQIVYFIKYKHAYDQYLHVRYFGYSEYKEIESSEYSFYIEFAAIALFWKISSFPFLLQKNAILKFLLSFIACLFYSYCLFSISWILILFAGEQCFYLGSCFLLVLFSFLDYLSNSYIQNRYLGPFIACLVTCVACFLMTFFIDPIVQTNLDLYGYDSGILFNILFYFFFTLQGTALLIIYSKTYKREEKKQHES
jgi:hypothetical protein